MSNSRFNLLAIGQRFRYEGETYRKHSPLIALGETDGRQRFMPRSAEVEVIDGAPVASTPSPEQRLLPKERVVSAFEAYRAACERCLAEVAAAPETVQQAREQMNRARERFLSALED